MFRLLGPLEAEVGGALLDLGPPKQRRILAALLLARGRVVPLQQLIEAVWGDDPPPRALGSLHAYMSRARAVLRQIEPGPVSLVRQSPGYRLDGALLDLDDFERLSDLANASMRADRWEEAHQAAETALSLWRGPLLTEFPDDDWVSGERRSAGERMERCIEVLATALLGQGRTAEALEQARRLLDLRPLSGQAVWLYMLALHRCARSAEALDIYRDHARELDQELGLEPVPELRELQTAILREEPALGYWPNPVPAAAGRSEVPGASPGPVADARAVRLVGHADTMTQLERWLDELCAGAPRWLLLTGAAGVGKTRLAEEVASRYQARADRIVWTSCLQDEGVPSWWSLRPLVRHLGGDPGEMFGLGVEADADASRFAVYDKLAELLGKAAIDGPVLVVIDDVQWIDAASARAVAHLLQTMRNLPLGVVLTLREGPRSAEVDAILTAFARHPAAPHIEVGPLDASGIGDLLSEVAGTRVSPSEAFILGELTGGNPLLLTEYARLPPADRAAGAVPLAVREVLGRRFARFDGDAMRVLHTAAVVGGGFEPALLAAATGFAVAQVVDVLDAAAHESIIVPAEDEPGYQFGHGLLREHLLGELSPVRKQALHAAIAAAVVLRDGSGEDILRRAEHLSAAMPLARSATVLAACREAAQYAETVWDWEAAARQWAAARRVLGPRGADEKRDLHDELLVAEAGALVRAGRGRTLVRVVDDALRDASDLRHSRTAARLAGALLRCCGAWPWTAYGRRTSRVLDRLALASEAIRADAAAQVPLLSARAVGHSYASDLRIPEELSRQALALAEELDDPDALADALLGRALTIAGVPSCSAEITELLDRLADLPHRHASTDAVLRDTILTAVAFGLGDLDAMAEHLRRAAVASDVLRLPVARVQVRWAEVALAHWHGDLDRAAELAVHARERHAETELYGAEGIFLSTRLAIRWERGTLSEAGPEILRSCDSLMWSIAAAAEAGDRQRGGDLIRAAIDPAAAPSDLHGDALLGRRLVAAQPGGERSQYWYTLGSLCIMAHAMADLGLVEAAPEVLELLVPHVGYFASMGQTAPLGPVSLPVGRLHALLGHPDAAARAYADAAEATMRAGGGPTMVRVRAAQAELVPAGTERDRQLAAVAAQAERAGLLAVAKRMRKLAGPA